MTILYIGETSPSTTSGHRLGALRRIGHEVTAFDLTAQLRPTLSGKISSQLHYRSGYRFLQKKVLQELEGSCLPNQDKADLVWINSGELLGPKAIRVFKSRFKVPVVLYNNDDPTGGRDGRRWDSLKRALRSYDLIATMRESSRQELSRLTTAKVLRVWMSYDQLAHAPDPNWQESDTTDIAFVGTWMRGEQRENILRLLYEGGLKVQISGSNWKRCPDQSLVSACGDKQRYSGRDYVRAVSSPKITLGLLSRGNRDFHTRRSLEIPYAGGLLCAERTDDHLRLYREDEEAVFWSTAEECVEKCKWLLANPEIRTRIRKAGMKRVRELGLGNEDVCRAIVEAAISNEPSAVINFEANLYSI